MISIQIVVENVASNFNTCLTHCLGSPVILLHQEVHWVVPGVVAMNPTCTPKFANPPEPQKAIVLTNFKGPIMFERKNATSNDYCNLNVADSVWNCLQFCGFYKTYIA